VGRDTLYGHLTEHREELLQDEDFAVLVCPDKGRTSVPTSLTVSLPLLPLKWLPSSAEEGVRGRLGTGQIEPGNPSADGPTPYQGGESPRAFSCTVAGRRLVTSALL